MSRSCHLPVITMSRALLILKSRPEPEGFQMHLTKLGISLVTLLLIGTQQCHAQQKITMRKLPPCTMDSFVHEAQGEAEHIYGDEGTTDIPPYMGFDVVHRINHGIFDKRDRGLTTGHGSYLPDAWGADEFIAPPGEWSQSGANNGNPRDNNAGSFLSNEGGTTGGASGGSGQQAPVTPPYAIGPDWIAVQNTHNGQIMGWMAPGETLQQFFSGASGHLLPGNEAEGQYILQNQLGNMTTPGDFFGFGG